MKVFVSIELLTRAQCNPGMSQTPKLMSTICVMLLGINQVHRSRWESPALSNGTKSSMVSDNHGSCLKCNIFNIDV